MRNFTLMILAAGFGMRMESLTKNIPKPLLKINNSTLLTNTINFFENLGCKKFIINTHYLHENLKDYINLKHPKKNIYLIYEPQILDTGGGVKNSIKYFDSKNFLAVNADIYWDESNINDVNNFIDIIDQFENYFLLLSNQKNTIGIERSYGDFVIHNDYVRRWMKGDPVIFFSGLQILNPKIFDNFESTKFSMNKIWDKLILEKKLKAKIMKSKLFHIGNIKTFNKIIS